MDKYLYILEEEPNGDRYIHLQANIYANGEVHNLAEWSFMYLPLEEAIGMVKDNSFFNFVDEKVKYIQEMSEKEAVVAATSYFNNTPGTELNIADITKDTPCGNYWFSRE